MAQPEPIIIVDQLVKTYDGKNVVDSVSFEVQKGEIFGILGPNGAGKTTTLEILEALRPIDGGTATIDGIDVASAPRHIKNIIGIQLQSTMFYDKLTLREQLKMFASSSRAGKSNVLLSLRRWSITRRCYFLTSRPRVLIRRLAAISGI